MYGIGFGTFSEDRCIAISYPEGNKPGGKRANGVIKIGLLNKTESGYEVEWKYSYSIGGSYAYSCLAINKERIAVLYERDMAVHTNELVYLELPLEVFGIIDIEGERYEKIKLFVSNPPLAVSLPYDSL